MPSDDREFVEECLRQRQARTDAYALELHKLTEQGMTVSEADKIIRRKRSQPQQDG